MNDDAFRLENLPDNHEPWRGEESVRCRQTLLLAGLYCLAGQQDLFATDGTDGEEGA